jgi:ribosomal-protein-alanine acetyltransferase
MQGSSLRDGKPADLAAICAIEEEAFTGDRLSPRSIRRLLASPSASLRVASVNGRIAGYHLVLTRSGSSVARLYSIAVADDARGRGLGEVLLADAERTARRGGARALRLEVRPDNAPAIRLYGRRGFRPIGTYRRYYDDGADALRFEKGFGAGAHAGGRRAAGTPRDEAFAAGIGGGEA